MAQDLRSMNAKRNELIRQQTEILRQIGVLDNNITEFNNMSPVQRLAVLLHNKLCHVNHTDGCEWEYEFNQGYHVWTGLAHQRWARRAQSALDRIPAEGLKAENIEKWLEEML